jgi:hypothetical protein
VPGFGQRVLRDAHTAVDDRGDADSVIDKRKERLVSYVFRDQPRLAEPTLGGSVVTLFEFEDRQVVESGHLGHGVLRWAAVSQGFCVLDAGANGVPVLQSGAPNVVGASNEVALLAVDRGVDRLTR